MGRENGRVEIPVDLFHGNKLSLGQWIFLCLSFNNNESRVIYGRAWLRPLVESSTTHSVKSIEDLFVLPDSPTVYRSLLPHEQALLDEQNTSHHITPMTISNLLIASSVTLRVTTRDQETLSVLGLSFNDTRTSEWAKKRTIRHALEGLVFRRGCIISRADTGLHIEIKDVTIGMDAEAHVLDTMIGSDTLLHFHHDESPESTVSVETDLETRISSLYITDKISQQRYPGMAEAHRQIMEVLMYPVMYPELISHLNLDCPKGVLLHGPPGVGKTRLVVKIAESTQTHLVTVSCADIHSDQMGESEQRLRLKFDEARSKALKTKRPVILFIDELDALTPHRSEASASESRLVAQMLTLLDGMEKRGRVVVIAATNRPNAIDPALRRPGRLDREIAIDVPSESTRLALLQTLTRSIPLDVSVSLSQIASQTNGFVAADLVSLVRESALCAALASRTTVSSTDITTAFKKCGGAASKRGYTLDIESLSWSSLGGMGHVRDQITRLIEWPLLHGETFQRLGLRPARGILMYGPPGCSKTTIAKIVASNSKAPFFSLNGAQIYSAYVGESERILRSLFSRARMSAPSIIFLDEVDALVGSRGIGEGGSGGGSDPVRDRILSTLLNEMDGIEMAKGILVMGATNRPDMIDSALLRPGRFDRTMYIPAPTSSSRLDILNVLTQSMPIDPTLDLSLLSGDQTEGFTGADLKALCTEAALEAAKRARNDPDGVVQMDDFKAALKSVCASVTVDMQRLYDSMVAKFGKG